MGRETRREIVREEWRGKKNTSLKIGIKWVMTK